MSPHHPAKKLSLKDIAEEANCSVGVVSAILNRGGQGIIRASEKTRERIVRVARKHGIKPGYTPNRMALLSNQDPSAPIGYTEVLESLIIQEAVLGGMAIEMMTEDSVDPRLDPSVTGVIAIRDSPLLDKLGGVPYLPVVTVNIPKMEQGLHSVSTDHEQQGLMGCLHAIKKGHRRIALLESRPNTWGYSARVRGYKKALSKNKISFDPSLVGTTEQNSLSELLEGWVESGVTLILIFHATQSLEALHILSNVMKLNIGSDISTICIDDLPIFEYLTPPQTVIHQSLLKVAKSAVGMMQELVVNPAEFATCDTVDQVLFSCKLIERDSVRDLN